MVNYHVQNLNIMLDMIVATKKDGILLLSAMKKGTKLTDNPKDYMLRVRMDKEIVGKLDTICKEEKIFIE